MADSPKPPMWRVSNLQRSRARALRANSTDAERRIWATLRAQRLNGASFRRQVPIGPYIVDFVCHAANLVIELDGGQHFESEHERRDAWRDAFLARNGFRVLRFSNYDVMKNLNGVLEVIAAAVAEAPSLSLQPKSDVSDFGQSMMWPNSGIPEFGRKRGRGPCGAARRTGAPGPSSRGSRIV